MECISNSITIVQIHHCLCCCFLDIKECFDWPLSIKSKLLRMQEDYWGPTYQQQLPVWFRRKLRSLVCSLTKSLDIYKKISRFLLILQSKMHLKKKFQQLFYARYSVWIHFLYKSSKYVISEQSNYAETVVFSRENAVDLGSFQKELMNTSIIFIRKS